MNARTELTNVNSLGDDFPGAEPKVRASGSSDKFEIDGFKQLEKALYLGYG
jgi:hypothetical protein